MFFVYRHQRCSKGRPSQCCPYFWVKVKVNNWWSSPMPAKPKATCHVKVWGTNEVSISPLPTATHKVATNEGAQVMPHKTKKNRHPVWCLIVIECTYHGRNVGLEKAGTTMVKLMPKRKTHRVNGQDQATYVMSRPPNIAICGSPISYRQASPDESKCIYKGTGGAVLQDWPGWHPAWVGWP